MQRKDNAAAVQHMDEVSSMLAKASPELTAWDETLIRQLVDTVKVLSADAIKVYLRGGIEMEEHITG